MELCGENNIYRDDRKWDYCLVDLQLIVYLFERVCYHLTWLTFKLRIWPEQWPRSANMYIKSSILIALQIVKNNC